MVKILSSEPFSTSRRFFITGSVWCVVGSLVGLTAALEFLAPDLLGNVPWLVFGRLRPAHVNLVALGFVVSMLWGSAFYLVPKLTRARLFSERLGNLTMWLWNLLWTLALATLLDGRTQAREYAELIWPLDVLLAACVVLIAFNFYMTFLRRVEKRLFVSLWYIGGAIAWTAGVYVIGNVMWNPPTGALQGITDSIWLWFYGHNVVGLIITPMAVAAAYYIIPRAVRQPVWSHSMSLIGFWVLLVMYTHVGTHHLIQAPVPHWLKVVSIVDSIALIIPVFVFLANVWMPMRGRWGMIRDDVGARFVFAGTIWYALTCVQGPLHSLPSVQRVTHFTNWVVAHAHIAILGFAGMIGMGALYTFLPEVSGKPLYSRRMAEVQYWMILLGVTAMFVSLTFGGLVQGHGWLSGETVYRVLPSLTVYYVFRAASGVLIFLGIVLQIHNVLLTVAGRGCKEARAAAAGEAMP